jgi:hypothetical protein
MPKVKAIAKKDLMPFFKKGDKVTIVPVLYKKDTLICNKLYGVFKDGIMVKIAEKWDFINPKGKNVEIKEIADEQYALKGTYKDSYIELEDGRQYPSSLVRDYNDFFEKVRENN